MNRYGVACGDRFKICRFAALRRCFGISVGAALCGRPFLPASAHVQHGPSGNRHGNGIRGKVCEGSQNPPVILSVSEGSRIQWLRCSVYGILRRCAPQNDRGDRILRRCTPQNDRYSGKGRRGRRPLQGGPQNRSVGAIHESTASSGFGPRPTDSRCQNHRLKSTLPRSRRISLKKAPSRVLFSSL